jgi:hypothetical protein
MSWRSRQTLASFKASWTHPLHGRRTCLSATRDLVAQGRDDTASWIARALHKGVWSCRDHVNYSNVTFWQRLARRSTSANVVLCPNSVVL